MGIYRTKCCKRLVCHWQFNMSRKQSDSEPSHSKVPMALIDRESLVSDKGCESKCRESFAGASRRLAETGGSPECAKRHYWPSIPPAFRLLHRHQRERKPIRRFGLSNYKPLVSSTFCRFSRGEIGGQNVRMTCC